MAAVSEKDVEGVALNGATSPGLCLENSRCGIYVWSCGYSGCPGGGSCTSRGNQIHRHEKRASGKHFAVITRTRDGLVVD